MNREPLTPYSEMKPKSCLVCGVPDVDVAHIKTRGSGGGNDDDNVMHLCRDHHTEQHKIGIVTFVEKYWRVRRALQDKGWSITFMFGIKKMVRDRC